MSVQYGAIGWNRQKKVYDLTLVSLLALYLGIFVGVGAWRNPKRDSGDAVDPRIWNRSVPAAERGALHRAPESVGSSLSSAALQPPAPGRRYVFAGLGAWRVWTDPVSRAGECESARQSIHQQSAVWQCRRFSLSGSRLLRADHSLSDGCHEPRFLAAESLSAHVEATAHAGVSGLCAAGRARHPGGAAVRDQSRAGRCPHGRSSYSTVASSRGGVSGEAGGPGETSRCQTKASSRSAEWIVSPRNARPSYLSPASALRSSATTARSPRSRMFANIRMDRSGKGALSMVASPARGMATSISRSLGRPRRRSRKRSRLSGSRLWKDLSSCIRVLTQPEPA